MDFQENFLQSVWKYQYFDKNNLQTTDGIGLDIKKIGYHNFHEGPDFIEAHIKIGMLDYVGHVEVHRKASDWIQHEHSKDDRYKSVILHVVYDADLPILHEDGSPIPTLELKGKIWLDVIRNYERLANSREEILCGPNLKEIAPIIKFSMLEKALLERLETKSTSLLEILADTKNDWEETTFRWLFKCFGFKTNADPMLRLAESVPYRLLQKHSNQPQVIEAILFGQAGLIPEDTFDEYSSMLQNDYLFYRKKYQLSPKVQYQDWKMMGVRPHNFPYLRIAQLSAVLNQHPNLFASTVSSTHKLENFEKVFGISTGQFWQNHYKLGEPSSKTLPKKLSKNTLDLLMINFVTPLWYAYGQYIQDADWKEKCLDLLQEVASEDNFIIRKFAHHDWKAVTSFDSQGMLGLYHQYCKEKKCLDCKIGQNMLKPQKK